MCFWKPFSGPSDALAWFIAAVAAVQSVASVSRAGEEGTRWAFSAGSISKLDVSLDPDVWSLTTASLRLWTSVKTIARITAATNSTASETPIMPNKRVRYFFVPDPVSGAVSYVAGMLSWSRVCSRRLAEDDNRCARAKRHRSQACGDACQVVVCRRARDALGNSSDSWLRCHTTLLITIRTSEEALYGTSTQQSKAYYSRDEHIIYLPTYLATYLGILSI